MPALLRALRTGEADLPAYAARALGQIVVTADKEVKTTLVRALKHREESAREAAVESLMRLAPGRDWSAETEYRSRKGGRSPWQERPGSNATGVRDLLTFEAHQHLDASRHTSRPHG